MKLLAAVVVIATCSSLLCAGASTVVAQMPEAVPNQVSASHILIQYVGSARAPENITRTKAEALLLAQNIAKKAQEDGADFAALAMESGCQWVTLDPPLPARTRTRSPTAKGSLGLASWTIDTVFPVSSLT